MTGDDAREGWHPPAPEFDPEGEECVCCGATENLTVEIAVGDEPEEWLCDDCREKGRGMK